MCLSYSRRDFLTGAVGVAAAPHLLLTSTKARQRILPQYCALMGFGVSARELLSSSGDNRLDRALITELRRIVDIIPVDPGFKYIRDDSPNAFATTKSFVAGTRGTVLLGLNLISQEMRSSDHGGVAVAGICAHECGHIFQFFSSYVHQLGGHTAKYVELHADFLAGYYMGRRRQFSRDRIAVFARSIFSKGDYNFNDRNHHGTPEQRFEAMKRGYETGSESVAFSRAVEDGASFVRRL